MSTPPYGPAQGLVDWGNRLRNLPGQIVNTVAHPMDALRGLINPAQPMPANPNITNPPINWEAFQQADARNRDFAASRSSSAALQPSGSARDAARKKYPGLMSGGQ